MTNDNTKGLNNTPLALFTSTNQNANSSLEALVINGGFRVMQRQEPAFVQHSSRNPYIETVDIDVFHGVVLPDYL